MDLYFQILILMNDLNKNSKKYKIEIIDGYEIIKYARLRNEKSEGGFIYA